MQSVDCEFVYWQLYRLGCFAARLRPMFSLVAAHLLFDAPRRRPEAAARSRARALGHVGGGGGGGSGGDNERAHARISETR